MFLINKFYTNLMNRRISKKAFTLAEVLITLGIIGVVAAVLISGLTTKYQQIVAVHKLKKSYTTLYQAIERAQVENGDIVNWAVMDNISEIMKGEYNGGYSGSRGAAIMFAQTLKPYLKVTNAYYDTKTYAQLGYKNGKLYYKGGSYWGTSSKPPAAFILSDGTIMFFYVVNSGAIPFIIIDINGPQKPNVFGRDLFCFYLDKTTNKERLVPYGNWQETISYKSCSLFCAVLILRDDWQIKYDW